ncbi:hypothetical protein ONS96_013396 [Cadophora gregata f. sp. sojae]|nr:hypothetical protein ONS96_013396 [Cadophora gregata f. sp. sojae]
MHNHERFFAEVERTTRQDVTIDPSFSDLTKRDLIRNLNNAWINKGEFAEPGSLRPRLLQWFTNLMIDSNGPLRTTSRSPVVLIENPRLLISQSNKSPRCPSLRATLTDTFKSRE